jgi:hypothetical protein
VKSAILKVFGGLTAVIVLGDDFAALITQLQLSSKAATHPVRDSNSGARSSQTQ